MIEKRKRPGNLRCRCGGDTTVLDSRPRGESVWRRRKCLTCGSRWSTMETQVTPSTRGLSGSGGEKVPERGPAVIRFFFEEKSRQDVSYLELERRSGYSARTMMDWRARHAATVASLDAALGVLGYELTVRRKK